MTTIPSERLWGVQEVGRRSPGDEITLPGGSPLAESTTTASRRAGVVGYAPRRPLLALCISTEMKEALR